MGFAIHYQIFVRNAQGLETPYNGLVMVAQLVCSSAVACFATDREADVCVTVAAVNPQDVVASLPGPCIPER